MLKRSLIRAGLISLIALNAFASEGYKAHWSYDEKTGSEHWGDLEDKYKICKIGNSQSPIDLSKKTSKKSDLKKLELHYKNVKLNIKNNGHTIQIDYPAGSYANFNGKKYDLLQFHFHVPSEHTFSKNAKPMEVHLVHKSKDEQLAVLGVLFDVRDENKFLAKFWDKLPVNGENKNYNTVINISDILPENKTYYNYSGSLTTPPCSEGVNWHVMTTVNYVSQDQVDTFKEFFNHNARPTKPLNEREVKIGN